MLSFKSDENFLMHLEPIANFGSKTFEENRKCFSYGSFGLCRRIHFEHSLSELAPELVILGVDDHGSLPGGPHPAYFQEQISQDIQADGFCRHAVVGDDHDVHGIVPHLSDGGGRRNGDTDANDEENEANGFSCAFLDF